MVRWLAILALGLGLVGCGEAPRSRDVPITPTRDGGGDRDAAHAVTKAPRNIATH